MTTSCCIVQRDPRSHRRLDDRLYVYPAARAIGRGPTLRFCRRRDLLILVALLARPGRVVARGDLIEAAWGDDLDGGPYSTRQGMTAILSRLSGLGTDLGFCIERETYRGMFGSLRPLGIDYDIEVFA